MRFKPMTTIFALALILVAGFVALTLALSTGAATASAQSERSGALHVTKNCLASNGAPGSSCTIRSSNLAAIKVGSQVFYDDPIILATPTGLFDHHFYEARAIVGLQVVSRGPYAKRRGEQQGLVILLLREIVE